MSIGIIGAGLRAATVYSNIVNAAPDRVRMAAVYDTVVSRINSIKTLPGGENALACSCFESVIDTPAVNAVLIATPNAYHREPAIRAMMSGKLLYLEKPLAATLEDSTAVYEAWRQRRGRVIMGFVLRYTPFYALVHELAASGRLGTLQYVHAEEHMDADLTANWFLRGWRAQQQQTGPLLLEKCCHDLDLINWITGARCESVTCISDRTVFVPRKDCPDRCSSCEDTQCQYRAVPAQTGGSSRADERIGLPGKEDTCVYNAPKDIADHTSLLARYEGGVHVTFNVSMGVSHTRRTICIVGSQAKLRGVFEEGVICLQDINRNIPPEQITIPPQQTGHGGGDGFIAQEFIRLFNDPTAEPQASVADGYESALVCFAAELAARENRPICPQCLKAAQKC